MGTTHTYGDGNGYEVNITLYNPTSSSVHADLIRLTFGPEVGDFRHNVIIKELPGDYNLSAGGKIFASCRSGNATETMLDKSRGNETCLKVEMSQIDNKNETVIFVASTHMPVIGKDINNTSEVKDLRFRVRC